MALFKKSPGRPLICLDFDGVLHSYRSGWQGAHVVADGPVPGAMRFLVDLYRSGRVDVAIYSARSSSLRGRRAMRRWLEANLLEQVGFQAGPLMEPLILEIMEWVRWPWFKPPAHLTLDDRAVCFTGEWPDLDGLLAFRPWNKPRLRSLPARVDGFDVVA